MLLTALKKITPTVKQKLNKAKVTFGATKMKLQCHSCSDLSSFSGDCVPSCSAKETCRNERELGMSKANTGPCLTRLCAARRLDAEADA